jgi:hypothetical protein
MSDDGLILYFCTGSGWMFLRFVGNYWLHYTVEKPKKIILSVTSFLITNIPHKLSALDSYMSHEKGKTEYETMQTILSVHFYPTWSVDGSRPARLMTTCYLDE